VSEFFAFAGLGFRHIVAAGALDHILFLCALAAIYRAREWREALWVVTAFTVGHSITLALAVSGVLPLPQAWIEFLIPVTIVATCVENLSLRRRYRPVFAGVFGLVHGAGFANYLNALFIDRVAVPLFGFNVGIELGQLVVLVGAGAALLALDRVLSLRVRVVAVSAMVALVALRWAVERRPF